MLYNPWGNNYHTTKLAKVGASGLVNSIAAVAHHLYLSLLAAFTQPDASTLANLGIRIKMIFLGANAW